MTLQSSVVHPFARTLGPGPYRFVGTFDLGAVLSALNAGNINGYNAGLAAMPKLDGGGGSCAHCGHPILMICMIQTAEGKRFGIGTDCIEKLHAGGVQNLSAMQREIAAIKRRKGQERRERQRVALREEFFALIDANLDALQSLPHPSPYYASKGKTMRDWAIFCRRNSTTLGALKQAKHTLITALSGGTQ